MSITFPTHFVFLIDNDSHYSSCTTTATTTPFDYSAACLPTLKGDDLQVGGRAERNKLRNDSKFPTMLQMAAVLQ